MLPTYLAGRASCIISHAEEAVQSAAHAIYALQVQGRMGRSHTREAISSRIYLRFSRPGQRHDSILCALQTNDMNMKYIHPLLTFHVYLHLPTFCGDAQNFCL